MFNKKNKIIEKLESEKTALKKEVGNLKDEISLIKAILENLPKYNVGEEQKNVLVIEVKPTTNILYNASVARKAIYPLLEYLYPNRKFYIEQKIKIKKTSFLYKYTVFDKDKNKALTLVEEDLTEYFKNKNLPNQK